MASIGNYAYILKCRLAVGRSRNANEPLRLAHAVRHLGDAYHYAGRGSLAETCYVEALSIYHSHEDRRPLDFANAIRSFAVLKDELGAVEEAEHLWLEAHDIYRCLDVPAGVAECAARLALLARHRGNLQRSQEWLDQAITAADSADDEETLQYVREVSAQTSSVDRENTIIKR